MGKTYTRGMPLLHRAYKYHHNVADGAMKKRYYKASYYVNIRARQKQRRLEAAQSAIVEHSEAQSSTVEQQ